VTLVSVVGLGAVGRRTVEALGPAYAGADGASDVVVIATGAPQHELAHAALASGTHVVTTSDNVTDIEALLRLDPLARSMSRTLVVGAVAAPGLSGLLARYGSTFLTELDEIHVQSVGTGGPACAVQHHRALSGISLCWHDGAWQKRPAGTALPDPMLLHRGFPSATRVTGRLAATRRDRLTGPLPMLRRPHPEGLVGAVRVELRGAVGTTREVAVLGVAFPLAGAAAAVAATSALRIDDLPRGAVSLADSSVPAASWLAGLGRHGLRLERFEGTAARTAW
jgi:hypothetical protein